MLTVARDSITQDKLFPWLIFLGAMIFHAARLAYHDWGENLVSAYAFSDAELYLHLAWMKAFIDFDGGTLGNIIPLSPYILLQTAAYKLLGPAYVTPHIANALLASCSAVYMYLFTRNLFGKRAGAAAAFVLILSGPLLFYTGLTMKVIGTVFLLTGSLYYLERSIRTFQIRFLVLLSLFFAMLALERNNFLLAAPFIPILAFLDSSPDKKPVITRLLALALPGVCLVLLFALLFNKAQGTSPVSINFYIGNSHVATGAYVSVPGIRDHLIGQRIDVPQYPERILEKPLTDSEAQWFWIKSTLFDIAAQPSIFITLIARKSLMMLSRDVPGSPEQYSIWRWRTPFLAVAVFDHALILALAIPGLVMLWRRKQPPYVRIFILLPAIYSLTVIMFFVIERYRFPLMVMLVPFAAFTISHIFWGAESTGKRLKIISVAAVIYVTSTLLNAINPAGSGWLENAERARASEERHSQSNKTVYEQKRLALKTNNPRYWRELSTTYHQRQMIEDAALFAAKAGVSGK